MRHNSFVSFKLKNFGQKNPLKVQVLRLSSVWSKFAKLLMFFFKAQVSSSSNFAAFLSVMTHSHSVIFRLKHNILSTNLAHQSANL